MKANQYSENRSDEDWSQPLDSQRSHSVEDPDEIRERVGLLGAVLDDRAAVFCPEFGGNCTAGPQHELQIRADLLTVVG